MGPLITRAVPWSEQTGEMTVRLSIGDFSRMTYLTVKALRHYQEVGILVPWSVDPDSGYRSYHLSQVPTAQVIKRLRDLDLPLESVRAVVSIHRFESGMYITLVFGLYAPCGQSRPPLYVGQML